MIKLQQSLGEGWGCFGQVFAGGDSRHSEKQCSRLYPHGDQPVSERGRPRKEQVNMVFGRIIAKNRHDFEMLAK